MVKFLPNDDYFDRGVNLASTDPVGFAESGCQLRLYLKRCLKATIDRNQNPGDLEKALQGIRITVPGLRGPPYIVREPPSAGIYIKTEKDEPICLGKLIDLF